MQTQD